MSSRPRFYLRLHFFEGTSHTSAYVVIHQFGGFCLIKHWDSRTK
uniref:Uncharacterized protein n=1 Tax=Anguilla anguilla TaxID=7936 RepID=A0A0E9WHL4_ANGAN